MHGNHAWIITGFTATADPAITSRFTVTSVRVVGPLWGLQNRTYGYDMRPDRKLTPAQLKTFFTPWHYAPIKMAWENRWVSVQPVAVRTSAPAPAAAKTPAPTARPTAAPTKAPAASSPQSSPAARPSSDALTGLVDPGSPAPDTSPAAGPAPGPVSAPIDMSAGLAVLVVALAVIGGLALGARRRS
jgi:hypothetical protein